ncbi:PREDICTED: U1 small nuclear ribonucleoprotein A isoform X2 [Nelumbo nucifera]|uniref:RRM domain-containing protein n=2 Tax=Nelumbo nucifera TaxID=4432 RepID=A0A822ZE94_NELNU|nr:PREDICTED: U1 small nuclear ribonucleoprotein A isoform X2 [Nelumbo nucifera]DAD41336.1 TPA_asm: hypothetical protein HUJ06_015659 [Nelumbo nucifera]
MDDMTAYYPPPAGLPNPHYPYYPPPPPFGAPPPAAPPAAPPPLPQQYHHLHHQQQPPFASYPPGLPPQPHSQDEVRTLFIAGLPGDVKPREIYNLFREFPGYQSSQLRSSTQSSQAFAFAVFSDQQSALAAMHALNGLVFDLEKNSTVYIDLAKSNSRSKRSRTDDGQPGSFDKKVRGSTASSRGTSDFGVGSNIHMPGMSSSSYNMIGYPSTQSQGTSDSGAVNDMDPMKLELSYIWQNNASVPHIPQNTAPCPTLFVANLGAACSEQELNQVFSRCPGFLKLKMQNKYGAPVAFVDFQDVASSTAALNHLQGTVLYSSLDGEGMRLEYAKSRMGLRKKAA